MTSRVAIHAGQQETNMAATDRFEIPPEMRAVLFTLRAVLFKGAGNFVGIAGSLLLSIILSS
jgi:hypothetical protein